MTVGTGTYLVTGVGRGIGRELARVLLARGERVIGTVPDPGQVPAEWVGFAQGGRLALLRLDARDGLSVARGGEGGERAGRCARRQRRRHRSESQSTPDTDFDGFLDTLAINTLGPLRIVQAFLPHLRRASAGKIVTISSRMGSPPIFRREGISVVTVHPGRVRTEMGGSGADISAQDSAAGLVALIDRPTLGETGGFFDRQGTALPF